MATAAHNDGTKIPKLIAPAGGVTAGRLYAIGDLVVLALADAVATAEFVGERYGEFSLPKATGAGTGSTQGQQLFLDTADGLLKEADASGRILAAICSQPSGDSDPLVRCTLIPGNGDVVTP